jgi:hypothetical protein
MGVALSIDNVMVLHSRGNLLWRLLQSNDSHTLCGCGYFSSENSESASDLQHQHARRDAQEPHELRVCETIETREPFLLAGFRPVDVRVWRRSWLHLG